MREYIKTKGIILLRGKGYSAYKRAILDAKAINAIREICIEGKYVTYLEMQKRLGVSQSVCARLKRLYEEKYGDLPTKPQITEGMRPAPQHLQLVDEEDVSPESLLKKIKEGVENVSFDYELLFQLSARYLKAKKEQKERMLTLK